LSFAATSLACASASTATTCVRGEGTVQARAHGRQRRWSACVPLSLVTATTAMLYRPPLC
jgi:hypothetical protein